MRAAAERITVTQAATYTASTHRDGLGGCRLGVVTLECVLISTSNQGLVFQEVSGFAVPNLGFPPYCERIVASCLPATQGLGDSERNPFRPFLEGIGHFGCSGSGLRDESVAQAD
jgi:hypothetical protein